MIAADVLVSPNVTFVGDPTMGRSSPQALGDGIRVLRAARIGTGAILFPPVTIGEEAVVGAALVRQDVGARTVVVRSPARPLRAVRDDELIAAWAPDGPRIDHHHLLQTRAACLRCTSGPGIHGDR